MSVSVLCTRVRQNVDGKSFDRLATKSDATQREEELSTCYQNKD